MEAKRVWYATKREWALAEIAKIDESLGVVRDQRYTSANWRKIRAKAAASGRLHARRERLAKVAGLDFDDGPTPF